MRRTAAVLLLLCALVGTGLGLDVLTARPASAHAALTTTTPADGARVETAPAEVSLAFNEAVSLGAGYARVLDGAGERVDTGAAEVRDGTLTVPLRPDLPDAGYVVTWRVVSADSHPISGASSFVVGDGEPVAAGSVGSGDDTDPLVAIALPLTRSVGYLGLVLGLGVPLALATVWPGGWAVGLMRRLTLVGLVTVAVTAGLLVLLQGPYASGSGLGSLVDGALVDSTLDSDFGKALLLREALAVALAIVLARSWREGRAPSTALLAVPAVVAVLLVVSVAAVGHAVAGPLPLLAVAATALHVAAMSAWLGGLVALFAGALRAATPAGELAAALPRWSRLAAGYVAALVLTGLWQSLREVSSFAALTSTTYGWVLVAKLALVALVLVAALVSRDVVQQGSRHRGGGGQRGGRRRPPRRVVAHAFAAPRSSVDGPADHEPADDEPPIAETAAPGVLRRSVLVELAGAAVVLALSAVLVGTPPASAAVAESVEVTLPLQSAAGAAGNGSVQVTLDPASPGPAVLHVYLFDDAGRLVQPRQISVGLTEPARQIGPLDVDLAAAGPGHYVGDPVLPTTGTWSLTVTVRLDEFTAVTASTVFPVR
ncbi:copper resistance protein CopC [Modestobacter sp. VKM Ac-2986]|uniref:copper resistance CopC/CopD family protein n=1 Tax=Modestobacter sp. VKM Ac-2986 TaxID=3004140 RepID=UPI0022ABB05D|nr:FixH family protein [Modestobacter sp. VKM Ac-2986]MCZ2830510.1 copper resistance protein CopC [Modestobacter sp. VKM Ac-2986]